MIRRSKAILLVLIVSKFALQYAAIDPVYQLHRDEFLHLDLGRHLAFGYSSVPPATGLLSFLIHLLGGSVFWIKFFPALFGALTILVVWKTVETLGGGLYARILAAVSVLFSVFLRINTLYQPNSLDFLFWTTLLYVLVLFIKRDDSRWLYVAAVVLASGFLSKYNIAFLVLALIPAFLLTGHRKIFLQKDLYTAAGLFIVLVSPNLVWQIAHGFPALQHLNALAETQLVNVQRTDFLVGQLYFFPGSIHLILLALFAMAAHRPFRQYRLLVLTFLFVLVIFTALRAKNYYSIGLYPVYMAFGAVYLEYLLGPKRRTVLRVLFIVLPVAIFLPMAPLVLPILSPEEIMRHKALFDRHNITRWEDGEIHMIPQDYADMLGWKELAEIADAALHRVHDRARTLVQCDNYGQAGAINHYSDALETEALSLNADYINWYPLDAFEIEAVVLVVESDAAKEALTRAKTIFGKVQLIGVVQHPYAREKGTTVYLLEAPKRSINELLREEIQQRKASGN